MKLKKEVKISDIKSMSFFYTDGYAINSDVRYGLECDQKCVLKYKALGEDKEKTKIVNSSIVDKFEELFNKYEVEKWNGFNKSDNNVLDGNSFSFSITMKSGDIISASGYMKYPKNYALVRSELDSIFKELFEK